MERSCQVRIWISSNQKSIKASRSFFASVAIAEVRGCTSTMMIFGKKKTGMTMSGMMTTIGSFNPRIGHPHDSHVPQLVETQQANQRWRQVYCQTQEQRA